MTMATHSMILGIVSHRHRLSRAAAIAGADPTRLLVEQARAAAEAGADFFQIREPDLDAGGLLAVVRRVLDATGNRLAVYVNDRADVAVAAGGGAGVHLRSTSLTAARLRAWLPAGLAVTRAVHSVAEAIAAGPIDAVIAGTAAASASKDAGHPTLGLEGLRAIVDAAAVPVIALGGLGPSDWPWVARTGASGWAGIGVFLPTPGERVDEAVMRAVHAARAAERHDAANAFEARRPGAAMPGGPPRARVH